MGFPQFSTPILGQCNGFSDLRHFLLAVDHVQGMINSFEIRSAIRAEISTIARTFGAGIGTEALKSRTTSTESEEKS